MDTTLSRRSASWNTDLIVKISLDRHKCNRHTSPLGLVAKGEGGWALVKASENGQKIGQKVPPPDPTLYPLTYPILQILLQTPHGHVLHTTITRNLRPCGIRWYDLPSVDIILSHCITSSTNLKQASDLQYRRAHQARYTILVGVNMWTPSCCEICKIIPQHPQRVSSLDIWERPLG